MVTETRHGPLLPPQEVLPLHRRRRRSRSTTRISATLKDYITETGKIVPSRITGTQVALPAPARGRRSSARASSRCCRTPTSTEALTGRRAASRHGRAMNRSLAAWLADNPGGAVVVDGAAWRCCRCWHRLCRSSCRCGPGAASSLQRGPRVGRDGRASARPRAGPALRVGRPIGAVGHRLRRLWVLGPPLLLAALLGRTQSLSLCLQVATLAAWCCWWCCTCRSAIRRSLAPFRARDGAGDAAARPAVEPDVEDVRRRVGAHAVGLGRRADDAAGDVRACSCALVAVAARQAGSVRRRVSQAAAGRGARRRGGRRARAVAAGSSGC